MNWKFCPKEKIGFENRNQALNLGLIYCKKA